MIGTRTRGDNSAVDRLRDEKQISEPRKWRRDTNREPLEWTPKRNKGKHDRRNQEIYPLKVSRIIWRHASDFAWTKVKRKGSPHIDRSIFTSECRPVKYRRFQYLLKAGYGVSDRPLFYQRYFI